MATVTVTSASPASRGGDAAALVFEYMAATQAENGQPAPSGIAELPAVLRRECSSLQDVYRPPGVFLIADLAGQPAGCAGLSALPGGRTAEVRRLYVRPAHRGNGIARTLMSHAHHHAARHGMTRLILDVLPARTAVISFYPEVAVALCKRRILSCRFSQVRSHNVVRILGVSQARFRIYDR